MRTLAHNQNQTQQRSSNTLAQPNTTTPASQQPVQPMVQTQPGRHFEHDFSRISIQIPAATQTRLALNKPGADDEQDAERIADQVMAMSPQQPVYEHGAGYFKRHVAHPEQQFLQAKRVAPSELGHYVPPIVHTALQSSGQALDPATRGFMEARFGHDFGRVRIHTDTKATEAAQAVNALAFTVGQDVVFGMGQYEPNTSAGKRLLAHELTHVVQQSGDISSTTRLQRAPIGELPASMANITDEAFLNEAVDFLLNLHDFKDVVASLNPQSSNTTRLNLALAQLDQQWAAMDYYDQFGASEFYGLLANAQQVLQLYALVIPEVSMEARTQENVATLASVRQHFATLNNQLTRLQERSFITAKADEIEETRVTQREAAQEQHAIETAHRATPAGRREAALEFTREFVENEHHWWPGQAHSAAVVFATQLGRYYLHEEQLSGADIHAVLKQLGATDPALLDRAFYGGELLVYLLSEGVAGLNPSALLTASADQAGQLGGAEGAATPIHMSGAGFHAGFAINWLDLSQRDPLAAPTFTSVTASDFVMFELGFDKGILWGFGGALRDAFWDVVSALDPNTYIALMDLLTNQLTDEQWRYQLGQAFAEELHTYLHDVADDSPFEIGSKIGEGVGYVLAQIPLAWMGAKVAAVATGALRATSWGRPLVQFGEQIADALPWHDPSIVEDGIGPDASFHTSSATTTEASHAVPSHGADTDAATSIPGLAQGQPLPVPDVPTSSNMEAQHLSADSPVELGSKRPQLPPLTPAEGSLLTKTGQPEANLGGLPEDLAKQELDIVRRAEKTVINDTGDGYIYEVDLGNGHQWKGKADGTWCRFSKKKTNCTRLDPAPAEKLERSTPSQVAEPDALPTPLSEPVETGAKLSPDAEPKKRSRRSRKQPMPVDPRETPAPAQPDASAQPTAQQVETTGSASTIYSEVQAKRQTLIRNIAEYKAELIVWQNVRSEAFQQQKSGKRVFIIVDGDEWESIAEIEEQIKDVQDALVAEQQAFQKIKTTPTALPEALKARLRRASPGDTLREVYKRESKGIDQVFGGFARNGVSPDHIVPFSHIVIMDGFSLLSEDEMLAIVNWRDNLIAMDSQKNVQRGDKSWRQWQVEALSNFDSSVSPADRIAKVNEMIAKEAELSQKIQSMIYTYITVRYRL